MDKTLKWFKEVLGWYGQIESRDENGQGNYGCLNNIPIEIEALHIAPFTGIHMFFIYFKLNIIININNIIYE